MKVVRIFAVVDECLYSVLYDDAQEEQHEFVRLFDLWRDAAYLDSFFEEHLEDLQSGYWGNISVEEAILRTRKEANKLEEELVRLAEMGKEDRYETLSSLFKPLHNSATKVEPLEESKAKGSWLRVYAIRIEINLFVVTGGAIKLTRSMNERAHLLRELKKLDIVRSFLNDEENFDDHPIFELFL